MGTGFLVAVVVGSGIFAQRLSPDDVGLQLLENSIATGAGLVALILAFGSVSGAHFNPVVSLVDRLLGGLSTRETLVYVPAQVAGACLGAVVANLMFELPAVNVSDHVRSSGG
ncbi:MAG: aquaporin, partial [Acidimicrobiales bacterium]